MVDYSKAAQAPGATAVGPVPTPLEGEPTTGQYFPVTELPRLPVPPPVVREIGADNPASQPPAIYGAQPAEAAAHHEVYVGKEPIVVDTPLIWQNEDSNILECTAGNWQTDEGSAPNFRAYQWLKDGVKIPWGLDPKFEVIDIDTGHTFQCELVVANEYGSSLPALSNEIVAVYVVPAPSPPPPPPAPPPPPPDMETQVAVHLEPDHLPVPPMALEAPVIQQVLSVMSCTTGVWGGEPTAYAYQWQTDGVDIDSADSTTYNVQAAHIGTSITCVVTASNADGAASVVSNALVAS